MSIYRHLGVPAPGIAYYALHQAKTGVTREEYTATMKELHGRIAAESASINAAYQRFLLDASSRESQVLRGTIAQFLETPIRTDNAEVQRIFREAFDKFKEQLLDAHQFGLKDSSEGRVLFPPIRRAPDRKLLENGKGSLEQKGFVSGKGKGEIFESVFLIDGGANLDVLEIIVRDRLGIYATTHGKHLQESERSVFTAYNVLHAVGTTPAKGTRSGRIEAEILFSKPAMEYSPFRQGIVELMDRQAAALPSAGLSLLQRKLGLGIGEEFILRMTAESVDQVEDILHGLRSAPEQFLEALTDRGNLLIKEILL